MATMRFGWTHSARRRNMRRTETIGSSSYRVFNSRRSLFPGAILKRRRRPPPSNRFCCHAHYGPILSMAQRHHSTFFHAVLAAFGLLMRVHQSLSDVAVETPISGRDQSELESVAGTFVNYLPLRFRVDADVRFSGLLHEVREVAWSRTLSNTRSFGMKICWRTWKRTATLRRQGSCQHRWSFICQQDFVRPISAGGVALTAVPSVSPGALRPLTVFMVERADGWRLSCEVDNAAVRRQQGPACWKISNGC